MYISLVFTLWADHISGTDLISQTLPSPDCHMVFEAITNFSMRTTNWYCVRITSIYFMITYELPFILWGPDCNITIQCILNNIEVNPITNFWYVCWVYDTIYAIYQHRSHAIRSIPRSYTIHYIHKPQDRFSMCPSI